MHALNKLLGAALRFSDEKYRAAFTAAVCWGTSCEVESAAFNPAHPRFFAGNLTRDLFALYRQKKDETCLPIALRDSAQRFAALVRDKYGPDLENISNYLDLGCGSGLISEAIKSALPAHYLAKVDTADRLEGSIRNSSIFVKAGDLSDVSQDWCRVNGLPSRWDLVSVVAKRFDLAQMFELADDLVEKGGHLLVRAQDLQTPQEIIKARGLYIGQILNELPRGLSQEQMAETIMKLVASYKISSQISLVQAAKKQGWVPIDGEFIWWNDLTREYIAVFRRE